jgi:hypothetical protein
MSVKPYISILDKNITASHTAQRGGDRSTTGVSTSNELNNMKRGKDHEIEK